MPLEHRQGRYRRLRLGRRLIVLFATRRGRKTSYTPQKTSCMSRWVDLDDLESINTSVPVENHRSRAPWCDCNRITGPRIAWQSLKVSFRKEQATREFSRTAWEWLSLQEVRCSLYFPDFSFRLTNLTLLNVETGGMRLAIEALTLCSSQQTTICFGHNPFSNSMWIP